VNDLNENPYQFGNRFFNLPLLILVFAGKVIISGIILLALIISGW